MKLSAISILLVVALDAAVVNGKGVMKGQEPRNLGQGNGQGNGNGQGQQDTSVTDAPTEVTESTEVTETSSVCPDCFKCIGIGHYNFDGDGTKSNKTVTISSAGCKIDDEISWMCCIGADEGNCKTDVCDDGSVPGNDKCSGEGKTDTMEVTVDVDANEVTILAHDGQWNTLKTPFDDYTDVCGGNGEGTNVCLATAVDISGCNPPETPAETPETPALTDSPTSAPETPAPTEPEEEHEHEEEPTEPKTTAAPNKSKTGGDPHFTTWSGKKFDYHGECDLVLVNHPSFNDGQGLRVHIRTTRIGYFSYIDTVAVQIGSDALVFANDLDTYTINGSFPSKTEKNFLGGFEVKHFKSALHISLDKKRRGNNKAHIDLFHRKNGFPYVIFDGKMNPELFDGSAGLLGEWTTGRMIGRDGKTEFDTINGDATAYALEWQVRDTDPMLFSSARQPQFPTTCTPPEKMLGKRMGDTHMKKTAEKACAAWGVDKDECIFDVMATRNLDSAHPLSRHGNFVIEGLVGAV